ncbi:probable LRR receptor-like serine/threonine-protein kinase At2g16250 isoform X1 [Rhododendron vialii]|uniref:probable LRR receptor-like serine/threonine-protein kinase At2g16250 isoform X1 n=1 Tax=Rhododendron vialii TaxID=182163 RepID=UPI00265F07BE|nr:probable LRR receptor-like serine/threonine-protein kinase At2g16250 isoform X1 [Rhododendron vialii]
MVNQPRIVVVLALLFYQFHSTLQQLGPLNSTERTALLQLRSSLGLRSKEWPLKADPCSTWVGVQCHNGSVTGLNISGFRRTRIGSRNPQFSVDALARLPLLSSFNASGFLLPGSIPGWFGQQLVALQGLDLRSCSVIGPIPPSLGNLTSLDILYLSGNSLTGVIPSSLGQLSRLSVLDLSRNSLTGAIPPAIGTLSILQVLSLSNNSLSSSVPSQLGNLSSLVDLDLSSNSLSGSIPVELRGLRSLRRIVIGNNLLAGSLPGTLFIPLTQLQVIVLNHNKFTGDLPEIFWSMPELLFLDASANNFTGTLPNNISNANATAAVLNLSQNSFYGSLTSVLSRFSSIDLSGNYFQGPVLDYARGNASLDRNCLRNLSSQRSSTECASFYKEKGLEFDHFGLPKPPEKSRRNLFILAVVCGIGFIGLLVVLLVLLVVCTRKSRETNKRGTVVGPVPVGQSPPPPGSSFKFSSLGESFTYQQILEATNSFNGTNLIRKGHSGELFHGMLGDGTPVVIKRVVSDNEEAYMLELDFFSKVSHIRCVPLLGHCLENENEKFLVYKYMPNGDLSSSLYMKSNSDDDSLQSLDWITRLKIATGAAEGLSYLHHECNPPLVHRDVQASSILLDNQFEVRLGSLSEVCAQEGDTHQSMITRLLRMQSTSEQGTLGSPTSTCAYDIYCFGKVLLELVTGKLGISASNETKTKEWLEGTLPYISIYNKELVISIVDPSLIIDEDLLEEVWAMAVIAKSCLNPKPLRRPLMRFVLKALENPSKVVREDHTSSSSRLRTTSTRSWNDGSLSGSWHRSSVDAVISHAGKGDGRSSFNRMETSVSRGSGRNGGGDYSASARRHSTEIFPVPFDEFDAERDGMSRREIHYS